MELCQYDMDKCSFKMVHLASHLTFDPLLPYNQITNLVI